MTATKRAAKSPAQGSAAVARPTSNPRDIGLLAMLAALAPIAWCIDERHWDRIAGTLARTNRRHRGRNRRDAIRHIEDVAGGRRLALTPADCQRRHIANVYLERLQLLRCHHPRGWQPRIRLSGREQVDAALAAGTGAILWVTHFSFSDLVTKIALYRAGLGVAHLSRSTHGLSRTRLGARLLNPIRTTVERRYLAERIAIGDDGPTAALRQLSRRLAENGLVSITVGDRAERTLVVPFMDGALRLATGPTSLMLKTSAPLLPVFTVRERDGSFTTTIEPALRPPGGADRAAATRQVLQRYASLLEAYVVRYPDQCFWRDIGGETGR